MKKTIKLLCTKEGKKKQVAIGNVREMLKELAEILVSDDECAVEFGKYLDKIKTNLIKKGRASK